MHRPGSFTKNFAWHGHGFSKLHLSIQNAFRNTFSDLDRDMFRAQCGVPEPDLQLIPVNFFLSNRVHNSKNLVAIDELVHSALTQPHNRAFDRLALFAFHLNLGGCRLHGAGEQRPAGWANEYVREHLWAEGAWRRKELDISRMDAFLSVHLDASEEVRIKCRSNYRHLFELAGHLQFLSPIINSGAEEWVPRGFFLVWDRWLIDSERTDLPPAKDLVDIVESLEVHKLMGVPYEWASRLSQQIVKEYVVAGGLDRLRQPSTDIPITPNPPIELAESDELVAVERRWQAIQQQVRNPKLSETLKTLYKHRCMFCADAPWIGVAPLRYYVEGAHIKPLGRPHDGPDVAENLLVLCPNHHVEFDRGMLALEFLHQHDLQLLARAPSHPMHGRKVTPHPQHRLNREYMDWHRQYWDENYSA